MGRRAHQAKKKQGLPEIPSSLRENGDHKNKLSSRARARARRRVLKAKITKKAGEKRKRDRSDEKCEQDYQVGRDDNVDLSSEENLPETHQNDHEFEEENLPEIHQNDHEFEEEDDVSGDEAGAGDQSDKQDLFGEDESASDEQNELVRKSMEIEINKKKEKEEGLLEFQSNVKHNTDLILGTADGELAEGELLEGEQDNTTVFNRITEITRILGRFSELRDPKKSRVEYVDQLTTNIKTYYGYNDFLVERIMALFPPSELLSFLEANECPRPVTIRVNTLKTTLRDLHKALVSRGMNIDRIAEWCKVGLQVIESNVAVGATPEYISGHYIIQAASSFLPVLALSPAMNEKILDMCASPGGKTTHIAMCMRNTGCIMANDINKDRCKALVANIHRMGVCNCVVSNLDGRKITKMMGNFDRVLVDAPCTGSGITSKDPSVKITKSEKELALFTHTQKELLLAAVDCAVRSVGSNGVIVYSTCSILVEENEEVIDYVLKKRPNVQLEDVGFEIGVQGFVSFRGKSFSPTMKLTKRIYPHINNMDGFFIAKLRKLSSPPSSTSKASVLSHFQNFQGSKATPDISNGAINKKKKVVEAAIDKSVADRNGAGIVQSLPYNAKHRIGKNRKLRKGSKTHGPTT